jgi:hypothetical protein
VWYEQRRTFGLSSGEGLIDAVRDEVKKWNAKENRYEVVLPAIDDKRLLVTETEFGSVLAVLARAGNTLSPQIKVAWDGGTLQTMTRNNPTRATKPHISIIGHITVAELQRRPCDTEIASGLANRFLFILVKRSKELPFGGEFSEEELQRLGDALSLRIERAKQVERIHWAKEARGAWWKAYHDLVADKPGLVGAIVTRAAPQVVRLAIIYVLLDGKSEIGVPHLDAALAVWRYAEASADYVFGDVTGDPFADAILKAIRAAVGEGLTRTAISELFGRNQSSVRIGEVLTGLQASKKIRRETRKHKTRPVEAWVAEPKA